MEKKTFWMIVGGVLVVLALVVVWQTATISALNSGTGAASSAASSAVQASSGMVGGC